MYACLTSCCSEKVIALVEEALCNPVMSGAENSESERQESRSVCSKNVHHQSDCILRHLLTDFVTALKSLLYSVFRSLFCSTAPRSVVVLSIL